jgi:hypothetical protein
MMLRGRPERIPLIAAAAFVAACFVMTLWNLGVGAFFPRFSIRSSTQLYGMTQAAPAPVTLAAIMSGEAQTAFSRRIGTSLLIYPSAVRAKNQIEYSLFDVSGASSVAFGRDKRLYEWAYVDEYCARSGAADARALADWGDKIRDIQDYAASHGKAFLYVITPSKAAVYPEYLPDRPCASRLRGTTTKLPAYERALDERGIHYLDGSGLLAGEREHHAIELFPRGGTHWNALGAGLAAREVVAILKRQQPLLDLTNISTAWTQSREPQGTDRDLLNMLNLYWPDADYPVPTIKYAAREPGQSCRPAQIMEVGGSFLEQINAALLQSGCAPRISYWFYWDRLHMSFAGKDREFAPPRDEDRLADLAGSDVILLEENEMNIGETDHLKALHALILSSTRISSVSGTAIAR